MSSLLIKRSRVLIAIVCEVELAFTGWGNPTLPEEFSEIVPYYKNLNTDVPAPSWLIEMAETLVEHKDSARAVKGRYRKSLSTQLHRIVHILTPRPSG